MIPMQPSIPVGVPMPSFNELKARNSMAFSAPPMPTTFPPPTIQPSMDSPSFPHPTVVPIATPSPPPPSATTTTISPVVPTRNTPTSSPNLTHPKYAEAVEYLSDAYTKLERGQFPDSLAMVDKTLKTLGMEGNQKNKTSQQRTVLLFSLLLAIIFDSIPFFFFFLFSRGCWRR
jgi:hypothetical protein